MHALVLDYGDQVNDRFTTPGDFNRATLLDVVKEAAEVGSSSSHGEALRHGAMIYDPS